MAAQYRLPILLIAFFVTVSVLVACDPSNTAKVVPVAVKTESKAEVRYAPDTATIPDDAFGELVRYGRDLIVRTAYYLGPEGKAGRYLGNKMNCANCHLDGGTRPYGVNFLSTHGRYPQYRPRENRILTLAERVNNCIERPHNGRPMPLDSREMIAIMSYIKWLGEGVPVDRRVKGDQGVSLELPDEKLDPARGRVVYMKECARCHGEDGAGKMQTDGVTYEYPPLWGPMSYEPGSSMYRVIKAAQFIKANMPHDLATWEKPRLTDLEALQVAAFINHERHPRPEKEGEDYPNIKTKPIDYPFGPYDDPFPEEQHKYGPFKPIIEYREKRKLYVNY